MRERERERVVKPLLDGTIVVQLRESFTTTPCMAWGIVFLFCYLSFTANFGNLATVYIYTDDPENHPRLVLIISIVLCVN